MNIEPSTDVFVIKSFIEWDEEEENSRPFFEINIYRNGTNISTDPITLDPFFEGDDETNYKIQDVMDDLMHGIANVLDEIVQNHGMKIMEID